MNASAFLSSVSRTARLALAFAAAGFLSEASFAAELKQHNLGEKTGEALQKLKPLQEAKNWDGMIQLIDSIVPTVGPMSYDLAYILDIKAKLLLQKEQYALALAPWEQAVQISDANGGYFDEKTTQDIIFFLAQLCYQEGVGSKNPAVQQQFIAKASTYIKRWLQTSKKPTPEAVMFYASILYQQAVVIPEKVDLNLVKQARVEVEKGLLASIKPKEGLYVLLLAILQQENNIAQASEVLELLVKQYPTKKDYWPTLMATYLNLGGSEKDPGRSRTNYIRAINTIERAQALGHMKTPKDNYNLVTLYLTAGQFGKATELLYAGLKNGNIESDVKTWLVLGYYYQQANQELQAISVLKEAAELFPKSGAIELQIGEIYRQMERTRDSLPHYRRAVKKGGLDKPHIALQLQAYAAFEMEEFEEAFKAINEAAAFPESQKDAQLPRLKSAIEEAIMAQKMAKEEADKKRKI